MLCSCVLKHKAVESMMAGIMVGGLLAVGTSKVALRLKVSSLLSGIILSTMAYSINLRIMGKPNIALFDMDDIHFDFIITDYCCYTLYYTFCLVFYIQILAYVFEQ